MMAWPESPKPVPPPEEAQFAAPATVPPMQGKAVATKVEVVRVAKPVPNAALFIQPLIARDVVLPEVVIGTPDWQTPWELQLTGSANWARVPSSAAVPK
jgi:hypothetical protein